MPKDPQVIPVQYIPIQPEDDEIDLKEIIKTILRYKKFIFIFTFIITFLAALYAYLKTPIYEIQSDIMIGQINGKPVVSNKIVAEYLKALYKKELQKKFKKIPNAYLSSVSVPKKTNTFLTLTIDGLSNQYDINKKNEILKQIQNAYNFKIKKYLLTEQNKLQNLNTKLKSIDLIKVKNIQNQIKNLQTNIKINKNLIKFYKNKIATINNKINFLRNETNKITNYLNKLIKENNNNSNTSSNLIISTNIINYQNMLTNLYNQIKNLELEKDNILSQTLPNIQHKIEVLKNQIDNLQKKLLIDIPQEKQNIKNQIDNLQKKLLIDIPQEKQNIKNQINLTKLQIKNTFFTKEIGSPLMSDKPAKPKKKLIIIVAFITGFILSIFLVFFMEFIKSLKESE